jgi:hypothetical protein
MLDQRLDQLGYGLSPSDGRGFLTARVQEVLYLKVREVAGEQTVEIVIVHVLHPSIGKCDVVFQSL